MASRGRERKHRQKEHQARDDPEGVSELIAELSSAESGKPDRGNHADHQGDDDFDYRRNQRPSHALTIARRAALDEHSHHTTVRRSIGVPLPIVAGGGRGCPLTGSWLSLDNDENGAAPFRL